MDLENLKKLLKNNNLKPNFTYGQNFLLDEIVLEDMIEASGVKAGDTVLEIGPGIGNLTRKLLETGAKVLSVEKDPKFFPILKSIKKDFPKTFWFEIADVLEFDFESIIRNKFESEQMNANLQKSTEKKLSQFSVESKNISSSGFNYKVVANIPYYITGKILQMLFFKKHKPENITILTQKEVAQNIIAKPGKLSKLAISVQIFGEPSIIAKVPAKSFYPAPKVDSALLQIKLFEKPKINLDNEKKFFGILSACFAGKRKQLHNTLKSNLHLEKKDIDRILGETGVSSSARPQELTIEQWVKLSDLILNYSNYSN